MNLTITPLRGIKNKQTQKPCPPYFPRRSLHRRLNLLRSRPGVMRNNQLRLRYDLCCVACSLRRFIERVESEREPVVWVKDPDTEGRGECGCQGG